METRIPLNKAVLYRYYFSMNSFDDNFDDALEEEWAVARKNAGLNVAVEDYSQFHQHQYSKKIIPAQLSPYLLLFTGSFLGPFATYCALLSISFRYLHRRHKIALFGIGGFFWGIIHSLLSMPLPDNIAPFLPTMIVAANVILGMIYMIFLGKWSTVYFAQTRQTMVQSIIVLGLLYVTADALSSTAIFNWLGHAQ